MDSKPQKYGSTFPTRAESVIITFHAQTHMVGKPGNLRYGNIGGGRAQIIPGILAPVTKTWRALIKITDRMSLRAALKKTGRGHGQYVETNVTVPGAEKNGGREYFYQGFELTRPKW